MSLLDFTQKKFQPTDNQKEALIALDNFLESNQKCFLLKGYAGTGKTTITKFIADYLEEKKLTVHLMAPTGRAARILFQKTGHDTTTIHKGIYNLAKLDEIEINKKGKIQYKYRYSILSPPNNIQNIYLIDESSMISDFFSESDFFIFGSGRLLTDLLEHVALTSSSRKDKIIFIGDPAQLPPVTDKISGALSAAYLLGQHQIETSEFELTQVVRQETDSGILANATYLREQLYNKNKKSFELQLNFDDIQKLEVNEVVDAFLKENPTLLPEKSIIINYSNRSALDFNLDIRAKKFADKMQIEVNDTLMVYQNNYNYDINLLNGTMLKVIAVSPVPEIKSGMLAYDIRGNEVRVTHKFRQIKIELQEDGKTFQLNCMILENFLYSPLPTLSYEENIALYLDFKIRHPELKPKTAEFKDTLRTDPYFNSLRVKYGYAITCHKAQGGEWESPFINLDVSLGKQSDAFLRWTYTAITRARKKLVLFNFSNPSEFQLLKYNHRLIDQGSIPTLELPNEIVFKIPENIHEIYHRYGLSNAEEFLKQKFIEILAIADSENLLIIDRTSHEYKELYTFQKNEDIVQLIFNYKGNQKFSTIGITGKKINNQSFAQNVQTIFSKQVNIRIEENAMPKIETFAIENLVLSAEENETLVENLFKGQDKLLQVLYQELNPLLQKKHIQIDQITHANYQELYTFKRQHEVAVIQFYYDGIHRFTKCGPMIKECNSNPLLIDLQEAIENLGKL